MDSPLTKIDGDLRRRLDGLRSDAPVDVEIVPRQSRWKGLLRQLRDGSQSGVAYNVVGLTSISATVPKWVVERIATRRDVVSIRLAEVEQ